MFWNWIIFSVYHGYYGSDTYKAVSSKIFDIRYCGLLFNHVSIPHGLFKAKIWFNCSIIAIHSGLETLFINHFLKILFSVQTMLVKCLLYHQPDSRRDTHKHVLCVHIRMYYGFEIKFSLWGRFILLFDLKSNRTLINKRKVPSITITYAKQSLHSCALR